jgi:hypothetical protein
VAAITLWLPLRKASRLEGSDGDALPPPQLANNNNQQVNSAVVEITLIIYFLFSREVLLNPPSLWKLRAMSLFLRRCAPWMSRFWRPAGSVSGILSELRRPPQLRARQETVRIKQAVIEASIADGR